MRFVFREKPARSAPARVMENKHDLRGARVRGIITPRRIDLILSRSTPGSLTQEMRIGFVHQGKTWRFLAIKSGIKIGVRRSVLAPSDQDVMKDRRSRGAPPSQRRAHLAQIEPCVEPRRDKRDRLRQRRLRHSSGPGQPRKEDSFHDADEGQCPRSLDKRPWAAEAKYLHRTVDACDWNHAQVFWRPSLSGVSGAKPSCARAFETSQ